MSWDQLPPLCRPDDIDTINQEIQARQEQAQSSQEQARSSQEPAQNSQELLQAKVEDDESERPEAGHWGGWGNGDD